jgi:hypothetical protein
MPNIFIPVLGRSWESHFTDNGWSTIQDQIDDGYLYYLQPTGQDGFVEFVHDFGSLITSSTLITLSYSLAQIDGNVTVTPLLSTSTDNSTWTDHASGSTRVYASNFRYVKVRLDGVPDDLSSIARIQDLRILLSTKEGTVSGTGTTGGGGSVTVDITGEFIDVTSINPSPKYNASFGVVIVYDFVDAPNPTSITFYTYRADTGAAVGGIDFSYTIRGVKA